VALDLSSGVPLEIYVWDIQAYRGAHSVQKFCVCLLEFQAFRGANFFQYVATVSFTPFAFLEVGKVGWCAGEVQDLKHVAISLVIGAGGSVPLSFSACFLKNSAILSVNASSLSSCLP
jgi:hypothetical protein